MKHWLDLLSLVGLGLVAGVWTVRVYRRWRYRRDVVHRLDALCAWSLSPRADGPVFDAHVDTHRAWLQHVQGL